MDDRQGVKHSMFDRENADTALGSGAVDADFWALVCEDEEWLRAEFDAIVSEPAETPVRSTGRESMADRGATRSGRAAPENIPNPPYLAGRGTVSVVATGTVAPAMAERTP
jgi:hypothetical protein